MFVTNQPEACNGLSFGAGAGGGSDVWVVASTHSNLVGRHTRASHDTLSNTHSTQGNWIFRHPSTSEVPQQQQLTPASYDTAGLPLASVAATASHAGAKWQHPPPSVS